MSKVIEWKPIQLEGTLLANGNLQGLIGIEELIDYDKNTVWESRSSKAKRKREISESSEKEISVKQKTKKPKQKHDKNKKGKITKKLFELTDDDCSKESCEEHLIPLSPSSKGAASEQKYVIQNIKVKKEKGLNVSTLKNTKEQKLSNVSTVKNTKKQMEIGGTVDNSKACKLDEMNAWNIVDIPKPILKALAEQGFETPTQIQALTLPSAVLGRRDILGAAETGSGKTLAFAIPILMGILQLKEKEKNNNEDEKDNDEEDSDVSDDENADEVNGEPNQMGCVYSEKQTISKASKKPLYALILTPTRELAVQIKNHIIAAAKYIDIQVAVLLGGMASVKQERLLKRGPEIVVATPGRLWELIQEGNPHLSQVDDISFLAIDETDRMLEKGHFHELRQLLERINMDEGKKKLRQNFVFSATLTLVHELPKYLANKRKFNPKTRKYITQMSPTQKLQQIVDLLGVTDPKIVDVTQESGTASTLTECRITCDIDEKDFFVYYFLQRHPGRTLIFCNSIGCVKRLATLFGLLGCNPFPLHASMAQRQRLKNLERFRDDPMGILVATDVAARGLDIPCVEHVLHYQTPRTSESYVHRSGRTARASREGITVLLMEPSEIPNYLKVCRNLGRTQDLPMFPIQNDTLNAVKKIVNLARDVDKLELKVRRTNAETGWLQKAADDMDIVIDDFQPQMKEAKLEAGKIKKATEVKRKQLAELLAKPLFPKGYSMKHPLFSAQLNIPMTQGEQIKENAVKVMKAAIENCTKTKGKKKVKPLFKPKSKQDVPKSKVKEFKLRNVKGNNGKKKRNFREKGKR